MKAAIIVMAIAMTVLLSACNPDREAPVLVTNLDGGEVFVNTTQITMIFTATDNWDINLDYEILIDGEIETNGQMTSGQEVTEEFEIPEAQGVNVTLRVYDLSLNMASETVLVSVRDAVPPEVNIIEIFGAPTVTYTTVDASFYFLNMSNISRYEDFAYLIDDTWLLIEGGVYNETYYARFRSDGYISSVRFRFYNQYGWKWYRFYDNGTMTESTYGNMTIMQPNVNWTHHLPPPPPPIPTGCYATNHTPMIPINCEGQP